MNRYLPTAIIVVIVIIIAFAILPTNLSPLFTAPGGCEDARVIVHSASFSESAKSVLIKVQNAGSTDLALETFVTIDGTVIKLPTMIYLSSGVTDTFTVPEIIKEPSEVTVRDITCGVADLWKF